MSLLGPERAAFAEQHAPLYALLGLASLAGRVSGEIERARGHRAPGGPRPAALGDDAVLDMLVGVASFCATVRAHTDAMREPRAVAAPDADDARGSLLR